MLLDEFDNTDGTPRLINFIKLSQKDKGHWDEALNGLLGFVSRLDSKYKDQFSAEVCPYLENRYDIVKVHEYLGDDFSAILYLDKFNSQLEKVV